MQITEGQKILLQWFRHNNLELHGINKIRIVCKNIRNQSGDFENKNYLYHYLFPLVRIGLIEFFGEGQYKLSPPSLLHYKDKLVSINLNHHQLEELDETIINSRFHRSIVYHDTQYLKNIETEIGMKSVKPNIQILFQQIPTIKKIIDSYEDVQIHETKGFMFLNNNFNWSANFTPSLLGCFRGGENVATNRYLKVDKNEWKRIPSRRYNPDSFNWAYCYGRLLNEFSLGIEYNSSTKILNIKNIYFPIILERLLWLNSLNEIESNVVRNPGEVIFKNVSQTKFNLLNKIFLNQLKIS